MNVIYKMNLRKIITPLVWAFAFIAFNTSTQAQLMDDALSQPFNLDIEYGKVGKLPNGWWMSADYTQKGFVAVASNEQQFNGKQSLKIVNNLPDDMSVENRSSAVAYATQTVDAFLYRGRKIKVKLKGKLQDANSGNGFRVWVKDKFKDGKSATQSYNDDFITATEWTTDEVEFNVNKEADMVVFGVETQGKGPYYFDAFEIDYADRVNVEPKPVSKLSDKTKNDIYELGKMQYAFKSFHPGFEITSMNWNTISYKSIVDLIAGKSLKQTVQKYYAPYVGGLVISDKPIAETPNPRLPRYDEFVSYSWTHKGLFNPTFTDPLSSGAVNIYQPQSNQQAIVYKTAKLSDNTKNIPAVLSAMVKTAPIGPGAHAQLWLRYLDKSGRIIKTKSMYDDMIKSEDWTKVRLLDTVPQQADKISFVLIAFGYGEFWFDDIKLGFQSGPMISYINMDNDDFEDNDDFPTSWKVNEDTYANNYLVTVDKTVSYNGNALKIFTKPNEYTYLANEGETKTLKVNASDNSFYVNFPLNVYYNNNSTYPKPEKSLTESLKTYPPLTYNDKDFISRLATIAEIAGLKENFAFGDLQRDEILNLFDLAENKSATIQDILKKFLVDLDDPASKYWHIYDYDKFTIPAYVEALSGELVMVTNTYDEKLLKVGDRIIDINGVPIWETLNSEIEKSHDANKLLSLRKALIDQLSFQLPEQIELGILDTASNRRIVKITADMPNAQVSAPRLGITHVFDDKTLYLDLRAMNDKDFKAAVPKLAKYDNLIFDMRGNSLVTEYLLGFFTDEMIQNIEYRLEIFTRPGIAADTLKFKGDIKPLPGLENTTVYFVIDERTTGSLEQIAFLAKQNKIGSFVGFPTSGTIGQTNTTLLANDYNLVLSAFKAYDSSGAPLKGVAVTPDIMSGTDLKSVYLGYDNVIMMAYQMSQKK